jgi:hypothetical protein
MSALSSLAVCKPAEAPDDMRAFILRASSAANCTSSADLCAKLAASIVETGFLLSLSSLLLLLLLTAVRRRRGGEISPSASTAAAGRRGGDKSREADDDASPSFSLSLS